MQTALLQGNGMSPLPNQREERNMSGVSTGGRDSWPSPARGSSTRNTSYSATIWFGVLPGTGFLARVGTLPWASGSLSEMDNLTPTTGEGWVSGQVVLAGPSPSGLWPPSLHSGWCLDVQWVIPEFPKHKPPNVCLSWKRRGSRGDSLASLWCLPCP